MQERIQDRKIEGIHSVEDELNTAAERNRVFVLTLLLQLETEQMFFVVSMCQLNRCFGAQ